MIFDVANRESFENIKRIHDQWINDNMKQETHYIHKMLIGNKQDLHGANGVTSQEAERMCDELGVMDHLETSTEAGENIDEI